jgi:fimbrial chaperone protein
MKPFARVTALLIVVLAIAGLSNRQVDAHEVTPMRLELTPQSGQRSALLTLRNTRATDLPFEVVPQLRTTAPDGTETLTPAEGDFIVFPPQGLVKPGSSQAIRFEYVGEQKLSESRVYILDVREVPVVPPGFSGIMTVYNFGVAVYIKPPGAFDDLEVVNIAREGDQINFEIRNRGNDFAVLSRRDLEFKFPMENRRMRGDEFASRVANPVIPPNSVRQFQMRADGLPAGTPGAIRVLDVN